MTVARAGLAPRLSPQETVERTLDSSKADACIVIVEEESAANLRWANNELTTNGLSRGRTLTVIAVVEGRAGTAAGVVSRAGTTTESLEELAEAAEAMARAGDAAEDAQPVLAPPAATTDWDGPPCEASISTFSTLAPALADACTRAEREGRLLFGYAHHSWKSTFLGSTTGLRARHDQPCGFVEANLRSPADGATAWAGTMTAEFGAGEMVELEAHLRDRTAWMRRRLELPAGRYEVLLPPPAVSDLMVCAYFSAGARDAHDGRSVFSGATGGTRVGERLAEVPLTLRSNPTEAGLRCSPVVLARSSEENLSVFDNGLPLQPTNWIEDGVLSALVQTRHSARLTGLPLTPRIDNLILEGPRGSPTEAGMVRATSRALLLSCLWYVREVEPQTLLVTGLTRDGVFLIEDGEVVGAVNNFRFNESPVGLLSRVVEAGASGPTLGREWSRAMPRTAMPTLRVADFNMSTVSWSS